MIIKLQVLITSRIENFRIKYFLKYWKKTKHKCVLCNQEQSASHLLNDCEQLQKIELSIYSKKIIEKRKKAQFEHKNQFHDQSWLLNWCLWKCYFKLIYNKEETNKENLKFLIETEIKKNEKIVLQILQIKIQNKSKEKQKKILLKTKEFLFFKMEINQTKLQIISKQPTKQNK